MKIELPGIFKRRKRHRDDDPRMRVTKDISPSDFVLVNDQSYMYREKVLPQASTVEFWEQSGLVNFLANSPSLKNEILDVGCGSGEIDIILARKGFVVTGIDISPYAVSMANTLASKYPDCNGRLRFVVGDIESISFEKKFASAIISHTFEHVIHPDKVMENVIRFLEPESHVLVAVPNKKAWRDRTHLRYYTERSMRKFLSRYSDSFTTEIDHHERMIFASAKIRN
ncbi:MAG TPA: class I SAM-dependent methyltransferase [Syntrophorhabdaceae bacterium]|nr:class I SAM-dependent methyltransferase [Syntrophorhabdaceae bacterium]HQM81591.1 class I SAM-dependent methyltransferase [Syntrophorhabdaceae bacterium]